MAQFSGLPEQTVAAVCSVPSALTGLWRGYERPAALREDEPDAGPSIWVDHNHMVANFPEPGPALWRQPLVA